MTKQVSAEARACPFCGKQPIILSHPRQGGRTWHIQCEHDEECFNYESVGYPNRESLLLAWNTRATLPSAGDGKDPERLDWLGGAADLRLYRWPVSGENVIRDNVLSTRLAISLDFREAVDTARAAKPSPPPPQPAAEGETFETYWKQTGEHEDNKEIFRHVWEAALAFSQARIVELERELAQVIKFSKGLQESLAVGRMSYAKSEAREADLTAAARATFGKLVELRDHVKGSGDRPPSLWHVEETLDALLKPASALTATKEER